MTVNPVRSRRLTAQVGTSRLVASSVALAFVIAACGNNTSSSGKLPTGPVTMGVLSCFTGTLASLGQAMLQGSQVAQKAINDAGGILGQRLTITHADTHCDEADSVPALHHLPPPIHVFRIH